MKNVLKDLGINNGSKSGSVTRRDFLKTGSIAGGGLMLVLGLPGSVIARANPGQAPAFEPNAYLSIRSDGKVIIYSKNPEIGQGVKTSMSQIVAEELEVDWRQVEVLQGALDSRFGPQFAGGSTGIKINFDALRRAGATAREMLIQAAANRWKTTRENCVAEAGEVLRKDSNAKLAYAALVDDAAALEVPSSPALKPKKDYKIIGKPLPGVDNAQIVTGKAEFGIDARPKGMLVAVVERCRVYGGKVKSFDASGALKIEGVTNVIKIDAASHPTEQVDGIAVVATNTWAAMKGRKALKIEWDNSGGETESDTRLKDEFEKSTSADTDPVRNDGDVDDAFRNSAKIVEGVYEVPFLAHATMEPMNYIADVRPDSVDVWGPTQVPGSVRAIAARITGVPPANIKVRMTRCGGGFGRRLMADYACEAVFVSKAIGKPVQVVWTREDDMQHDYYRPAGMYKLKAGLDRESKLVAWHIKASTTSRYAFAASMDPHHVTEIFPDGFPAGFVPNFRMQYQGVSSKVPRGAWRAPGHNATAWVDQCFVDEVAAAAGKNPVDFRLELLGDQDRMMPYRDHGGPEYSTARLKNVIRVAADKSGWYKPSRTGTFRGFASHFMFGAYVAEVVEISMPSSSTIKVEKALAVVDCGLVVNPSGAKNQLEGGLIDGLSAALHQAIHIEDGGAKENNFNSYKLLRMNEAPRIEVHLVDSDAGPEGLGEMTLPPVSAALCNAIFSATGKRIRKLPLNLSDRSSL